MKRVFDQALALVMCISLVFSMCGCSSRPKNNSASDVPEIRIERISTSSIGANVSAVGTRGNIFDSIFKKKSSSIKQDETALTSEQESSFEEAVSTMLKARSLDDIYSVISSSVEYKLNKAGFITGLGVAHTSDNNYTSLGIYYLDDNLDFFTTNELLASGFIEIVEEGTPFFEASASEEPIVIEPIDDSIGSNKQLICTYTYNDIQPSHFVYQDKYVKYYLQTGMRIVYSVVDNSIDNYDLSLGSLYNYDKGEFIYDETIFSEYEHHSGTKLFSDRDYAELEKALKRFSEEQYKAGYTVSDYTVVYISPESIEAYLESEEDNTFFGYSVRELTETLGMGSALEYTSDGFKEIKLLDENAEDYDWKSFLKKIGIGTGIIIVGAVLTPITGGASFGCALLTITEITASVALTSALGNLAIQTAKGMMDGNSIKDSLMAAKNSSLDAFANGFIIGAVIGSVGVASGIIKPTACFVAGTPVAVLSDDGKNLSVNIEEVQVGDSVYSFDEDTGKTSPHLVTDIISRNVKELLELTVCGEKIITTCDHPFYVEGKGWKKAIDIQIGDRLQNLYDSCMTVEKTRTITPKESVTVYNLTVDKAHTYYVGRNGILVHNVCDEITKLRNEGVRNAWKEEVEAVKNGTSKYNWTTDEIEELLTKGKVSGYDGHHIITVNELKGTINEKLIADASGRIYLYNSIARA